MPRFRTSITRDGPAVAATDNWNAVFRAPETGAEFSERVVLVVRERSIVPLVLDDDGLGFTRVTDWPNFVRLEQRP